MKNDDPEKDDFIPTRRSLLSHLRNFDDETSWRDFFDTYWKLIYRSAVKSGLSPDEAEDVVQETIITVSRRIQEFKYDPALGSFKGWLLHTTRWRIKDHFRKRKRQLVTEPLPDDNRDTNPVESIPDPVSARLDALWDKEWQQNLVDAAIQRVKRKVEPKHFQIFELHTLKQRPADKVAKTFGVNIAQIHLIKHRVGNLIKAEVKRLEEKGI